MLTSVRQNPAVRFGDAFFSGAPDRRVPGEKPSVAIATIKNKDDFDASIRGGEGPVLVKFEMPHCKDCEEAEPFINAAARDNPELNVFKALMWDETNPGNRSMKKVAFQHGVKTVPLFILYQNGQEVARGEKKEGLFKILDDNGYRRDADVYVKNLAPSYVPEGAKLTVLFDGECPVCTAMKEHLKTLDADNQLALVPLQSPSVREKYPELDPEDLRTSIHVVRESDGKVFKGAEAFEEMGRVIKAHNALGRALKVFRVAAQVPGFLPVADRIYLAFSKRRFKIKVKQAGCKDCELSE